MGSVELLRTPEEIDFTSKVLGESFWETKSFDNLNEAIRIDAAREANTRLLAKFDAFCNERGLKYFLYESSLQGALAYHDFIPGACDLNVGMLRADYDALIAACDKATDEQHYLERIIKVVSFAYGGLENVDSPELDIKKLYLALKEKGAHIPPLLFQYGVDDPAYPIQFPTFVKFARENGLPVKSAATPGAHNFDCWELAIRNTLDWFRGMLNAAE